MCQSIASEDFILTQNGEIVHRQLSLSVVNDQTIEVSGFGDFGAAHGFYSIGLPSSRVDDVYGVPGNEDQYSSERQFETKLSGPAFANLGEWLVLEGDAGGVRSIHNGDLMEMVEQILWYSWGIR